jgi:hypothetical protein
MQISELAPVWAEAVAGRPIPLPRYGASAALHRAFLACVAPLAAPAGSGAAGPLAIT